MGRWNEDRVVFTVKVLNNMAKNELNIVVNVDYLGRTFVELPGALNHPAGACEITPIGSNFRVCKGEFKIFLFFWTNSPKQRNEHLQGLHQIYMLHLRYC
jgi:hypothetical protein